MAPRRRVIWTREALAALEEIISYLFAESPSGAQKILSEALRAGGSLRTLGERGRMVPELNEPGVREIFVRRYRLIYRLTAETVVILTFLHGSRDFARWRRASESRGSLLR